MAVSSKAAAGNSSNALAFSGIPASPRVVFCGAKNKRTARPVQTNNTPLRILEKLKISKTHPNVNSHTELMGGQAAGAVPPQQYVIDMTRVSNSEADKENLYPSSPSMEYEAMHFTHFAPPPTPSSAAIEGFSGEYFNGVSAHLRQSLSQHQHVNTLTSTQSTSSLPFLQFHENRESISESLSASVDVSMVGDEVTRDDANFTQFIASTSQQSLATLMTTDKSSRKKRSKPSKKDGKNKSSQRPRGRAPSPNKDEDCAAADPAIDAESGIPRSPEVIFVYGNDAVPIKVYETHTQPGTTSGASAGVVRTFMRWWRARGHAGESGNASDGNSGSSRRQMADRESSSPVKRG